MVLLAKVAATPQLKWGEPLIPSTHMYISQ